MNKKFQESSQKLAISLIGSVLMKTENDGTVISGKIVETEAYLAADDLASHAAPGKTGRNKVMFLHGGHLYVYKIYGIHFCINVVAGRENSGEAVLIRAIEPLTGLDLMAERRGTDDPNWLCKGPGNVAKAFGFTMSDNGKKFGDNGLNIEFPAKNSLIEIEKSTRIGITKSSELELRYCLKNSKFVSGKNKKIKADPV